MAGRTSMSNSALRRTFLYLTLILCVSFGLYIFSGYGENRPLRTWIKNVSAFPSSTSADTPIPISPAGPKPSPTTGLLHSLDGEAHFLRPDGLLETNTKGRHPILDLVEDAKQKWDEKIARQSKTFHQAVEEYKRRRGRLPPRGYDDWWAFIQQHNVQLPDEYERIYTDLDPFWGIDPSALNGIFDKTEHEVTGRREYVALLSNIGGKLSLQQSEDHGRMRDLREFIGGFVEHLPNFKMLVDAWDEPMKFITYENREKLLAAARSGTYIDPEFPTDVLGWEAVCPPDSPLRTGSPVITSGPKTFIHDHQTSMDPCFHPNLITQNGFLTRETLRRPLRADSHIAPTFSISKTLLNTDILTVPLQGVLEDYKDEIPWEEKSDSRLMWRGSTTGTEFRDDRPWRDSQRIRLVAKTTAKEGTVDVLFPSLEVKTLDVKKFNEEFMDVHFANNPIQCWPNELCNSMKSEFEFMPRQGEHEAWNYKFIIDIDGNGWSSRFKKLLQSNSLILKATVHPAWYSDRIAPWYHYAPVQYDLSDLYDTYIFFRGESSGSSSTHDELAKTIALQGQSWANTFFRKRDMEAYMMLLILEYTRIMSLDRQAMTLDLKACTSRVCKSVSR